MNIFDISGKVIVLTGASGHIGTCLREHLVANGATVVGISRRMEEGADNYRMDLCDDTARAELVKTITQKYKTVDCLINNAYSGKTNKLENCTREDFETSMDIGFTTPMLFVNELVGIMPEHSSIINIASMYGMVSPDPRIYGDTGRNSALYYGAGKAALIQATRYLACHLAERKIRANAVSPGPFPPFTEATLNDPFLQKLMHKNPANRLGKPEDLCGVVQLLASNASQYINGANIPVDGGWTAW